MAESCSDGPPRPGATSFTRTRRYSSGASTSAATWGGVAPVGNAGVQCAARALLPPRRGPLGVDLESMDVAARLRAVPDAYVPFARALSHGRVTLVCATSAHAVVTHWAVQCVAGRASRTQVHPASSARKLSPNATASASLWIGSSSFACAACTCGASWARRFSIRDACEHGRAARARQNTPNKCYESGPAQPRRQVTWRILSSAASARHSESMRS